MKLKENNFRQELSINRFRLEEECENHSNLYGKYAELEAITKEKRNECKDRLNIILADRELYYRENPPDGISKITDAVIKALVVNDDKAHKVQKELREIEKDLSYLNAAVSSFEHRKSMLNNLTMLFNRKYNSSTFQENLKQEEEKRDEVQMKVRKNLKRKEK